jgi:hypothetical protein
VHERTTNWDSLAPYAFTSMRVVASLVAVFAAMAIPVIVAAITARLAVHLPTRRTTPGRWFSDTATRWARWIRCLWRRGRREAVTRTLATVAPLLLRISGTAAVGALCGSLFLTPYRVTARSYDASFTTGDLPPLVGAVIALWLVWRALNVANDLQPAAWRDTPVPVPLGAVTRGRRSHMLRALHAYRSLSLAASAAPLVTAFQLLLAQQHYLATSGPTPVLGEEVFLLAWLGALYALPPRISPALRRAAFPALGVATDLNACLAGDRNRVGGQR